MTERQVAVLDFETDPFKYGRLPVPFAWGYYDGRQYSSYWQTDAPNHKEACAKKLIDFLASIKKPMLILAHNGGKFDFIFLLKYFKDKIKIVNGRILEAKLGIHTLRDSYAILPVPLRAAGDKLDIDYDLMESDKRELHKDEIMTYLRQDNIALYDLVQAFYAEFGQQLTIGGTSMRELQKFHAFDRASESFDAQFRPYYYGGRCQCFESGIIETDIKVYDINSSYPNVMKNALHPTSIAHDRGLSITPKTSFIKWTGKNDNAVPTRTKQGLYFDVQDGEFLSTIHEFNAGLETGTIKPDRILETIAFRESLCFDDFIDHFYGERLLAKANKDVFHTLFYKLVLNSAYGKFAQNPEDFQDSIILPMGEIPGAPYTITEASDGYAIWSKPAKQKTYYNVATAASITGAARASLLIGLSRATRPLYCDTDSIFCEAMTGEHDPKKLGSWKLEATGTMAAIAGKKLYALFDGEKCVKKASKGTTLNPLAICLIARGDTCETRNNPPTFKLDGHHVFIHRNISRTH